MAISLGDKISDTMLMQMGDAGPEGVSLGDKLAGRKVVIFGVPGAFTPTCDQAHVPSFMRTFDALTGKGVDEVICVSVNDPFVMKAWGESTGAAAAGITMLADPEAAFTKAAGLDFTAPPAGLIDRAMRFALVADDGVVSVLHKEENPGVCDTSAGEAILDAL